MTRCAVVYFSEDQNLSFKALVDTLAQTLKDRGLSVDLIDGQRQPDIKLGGYHFIAIGCQTTTWFKGRLPSHLAQYLSRAGMVTGKRSFAFVKKGFFGSQKTLSNLMRAMEFEGMKVVYSDVISNLEDVTPLGMGLKIE